jgi:precorrin-3B methylase
MLSTNKVSRNDNEKDKAQLLSLADLLHNTASIAKQIAEVSERYNCVEDYIKHQYGAMLEQLRAHKYFPK